MKPLTVTGSCFHKSPKQRRLSELMSDDFLSSEELLENFYRKKEETRKLALWFAAGSHC